MLVFRILFTVAEMKYDKMCISQYLYVKDGANCHFVSLDQYRSIMMPTEKKKKKKKKKKTLSCYNVKIHNGSLYVQSDPPVK